MPASVTGSIVPATVKITIRNETPLTRDEGIDALNTILGLNQIAMVPEGRHVFAGLERAADDRIDTQH